ncbi:hypothetical protein LOK49_LG02G00107 [Camellia lanceoleosa]|uniref:Uncharacterized protein n=1 Tax=Camellia lanceoleosa TaxID=1840588 RepID=A0ACC0ILP8_9ERIC|nr:hypothetical protein LOK49_LG02G00107 [Camellia lanceoleosa]
MQSPLENSWMLTPPLLHSSAAIPFWWKEEPDKHTATATATATTRPNKYSLELLPRLQKLMESSKVTKMPSPQNTVHESGPYYHMDKPMFRSSSFRFRRKR